MSRTLKRSIARHHYAKFTKLWRDDLRLSGQYGRPNAPKRPTFNQWYTMHQRDLEMTKESSPQDVQEYLEMGKDPWAQEKNTGDPNGSDGERGVTHIQMVTPEKEDAE